MCPVKLLLPANVVCEGYVFTPVCDSVNWGVVSTQGVSGIHPPLDRHLPHPGQTPPGQTTPLGRHPPGQTSPLGRHPLGRQSPRQIPPRQTPPSRHPPGRHPLGRHPPGRHASGTRYTPGTKYTPLGLSTHPRD